MRKIKISRFFKFSHVFLNIQSILWQRLRIFVVRTVTQLEEVVVAPEISIAEPKPDLLMALLAAIAEKFPECCLERPELIVELAKVKRRGGGQKVRS